jgi:phosphatidylserine decarboxylase
LPEKFKLMHIHHEGHAYLAFSGITLLLLTAIAFYFEVPALSLLNLPVLFFFIFSLQFFRNPTRPIREVSDHIVYAPADGKIVAIEEVVENEYFKDKRIQVSIFMSPLNVHVNRNPISGTVTWNAYHPGKYLVAWHPKSSTENERTTVVIEGVKGQVLLRQIAGAVARRIANYLEVGQKVEQGSEMGFIKFGSRVDVFLPLDAKIQVSVGQKSVGNTTILAKFV